MGIEQPWSPWQQVLWQQESIWLLFIMCLIQTEGSKWRSISSNKRGLWWRGIQEAGGSILGFDLFIVTSWQLIWTSKQNIWLAAGTKVCTKFKRNGTQLCFLSFCCCCCLFFFFLFGLAMYRKTTFPLHAPTGEVEIASQGQRQRPLTLKDIESDSISEIAKKSYNASKPKWNASIVETIMDKELKPSNYDAQKIMLLEFTQYLEKVRILETRVLNENYTNTSLVVVSLALLWWEQGIHQPCDFNLSYGQWKVSTTCCTLG